MSLKIYCLTQKGGDYPTPLLPTERELKRDQPAKTPTLGLLKVRDPSDDDLSSFSPFVNVDPLRVAVVRISMLAGNDGR